LLKWKKAASAGVESRIRLNSPDFNVTKILDDHTDRFQIGNDGFLLAPGEFVLGWTAEKIQLPHRSRIAARVEGKSSLARLGLGVHVTAPTIHAGFGYKDKEPAVEGLELQLEIWNIGKFPIVLDPGIAICQLIFELVDGTPEKGYEGRFTTQGPETA
jgi:dCTP deaminase